MKNQQIEALSALVNSAITTGAVPDELDKALTALDTSLVTAEQKTTDLGSQLSQLQIKLEAQQKAWGDLKPDTVLEQLTRLKMYEEAGEDPAALKEMKDQWSKLSDSFKQQSTYFEQVLKGKDTELEKAKQAGDAVSEQAKQQQQMLEELKQRVVSLQEQNELKEKKALAAMRKAGITEALTKAGVNEALFKGAYALWKDRKIEVGEDETLTYKGEPLQKAVNEWIGEEGKAYKGVEPSDGGVKPASAADAKGAPSLNQDQFKDGNDWDITAIAAAAMSGDTQASDLLSKVMGETNYVDA